ncbi:hypothetical protein HDU86_005812 [Geranomyces michiganensis]|nr:hypothetical protein HDU86_005812 [Geranomyces michiganensis]
MDPTTSAIDVIELSDEDTPSQRVTRMQTRRAAAALQRQQPLTRPSEARSTPPQAQSTQPHPIGDTSHLQPQDKEIQRLLQVDMLSSTGDRNTLIRRHTEWTKRYNANIDEGGAKSHGQLVKELGEWERALAGPKVTAFTPTPRHEETQQTVLEREEHSRKYADEFEKMVLGLKKRKRAKLEAAASEDVEAPH